MKIVPAIFEEREIRRIYDEKSETWFFSIVDIVQVLAQQADYQTARKYWNKLKERLQRQVDNIFHGNGYSSVHLSSC